jgi:hypothetical protein
MSLNSCEVLVANAEFHVSLNAPERERDNTAIGTSVDIAIYVIGLSTCRISGKV